MRYVPIAPVIRVYNCATKSKTRTQNKNTSLTDDHEAHVADGALGGPRGGDDARQRHATRACRIGVFGCVCGV